MTAVRNDLDALAESITPPPRAFFVDELEVRLAAMMRGAVDGDMFPDIIVTRVEKVHRPRQGMAASIALVIVLMTAGVGALQQRRAPVGVDTRDRAIAPASSTSDAGDIVSADGGATSRGSIDRARPLQDDWRTTAPAATDGAEPGRPITVWPSVDEEALAEAMAERRETTMGLRGSGTPAAVFLEWDRYDGADFAAYLVLRAAAPDVPDWPDPSGRTLMLLRIESPDHVSHRDTAKVGTTPRYRVVAVNAAGEVVSRSDVFESDVSAATGRISQLPQPPTS